MHVAQLTLQQNPPVGAPLAMHVGFPVPLSRQGPVKAFGAGIIKSDIRRASLISVISLLIHFLIKRTKNMRNSTLLQIIQAIQVA